MIKLFGTDLDGTFLDNHSQISAANREAVHAAQRSGRFFAICSGWTPADIAALYQDRLGTTGYGVCLNGALVVGPEQTRYFDHPMPKEVARWAFRMAKHYLIHLQLVSDQGEIEYQPDLARGRFEERHPRFVSDIGELDELLDHYRIYKFTLQSPPGNGLALEWCARSMRKLPLHFTRSGPYYYEGNQQGITKYTGIAHLAEHLGFTPAECMCFGNEKK